VEEIAEIRGGTVRCLDRQKHAVGGRPIRRNST
jgi:hypothetical protein